VFTDGKLLLQPVNDVAGFQALGKVVKSEGYGHYKITALPIRWKRICAML
jgi:hypothetical protein